MPDIQKYLPTGWTESPSTPLEALKAARAVLEDEQRWLKGQWFVNRSPETDPENAYCNHWQVCAQGAIGIVTMGSVRYTEEDKYTHGLPRFQWYFHDGALGIGAADRDLYEETTALLLAAVPEAPAHPECNDDECDVCEVVEDEWEEVPAFNDHDATTHAQVMAAFDTAIATETLKVGV